jgi:hypothetical protein
MAQVQYKEKNKIKTRSKSGLKGKKSQLILDHDKVKKKKWVRKE